ncbi:internal head protein [Pseudomonas phage SL2]|uniref:Virion structural protein n=1 Tax=Pseudomonas phage SL2 TaxID=2041345 RepID=A0A2D1GR96_9CAUD|nr:internal head protein [Pseudomonas phage SL2]ATN94835.1 hypothetical protein SL2_258 [Pseudomonas phage SL2]
MSLLKMLDKLSLESIEDQGTMIHGDVELVVENETSADVSSVLAEVDQIENNPVEEVLDPDDVVQPNTLDTEVTIVQAEDELGQIENAKEALEKFQGLLLQAGEDGISRQAAAFMHVGMESIDRILGIEKSELTAALENYDASPRSAIQKAAVISLEDIKEKLKEAGKKALEIIKKIIAMLKQKIKDFNPKLVALEMRIDKTIDGVKTVKASSLKKEEVKFTPTKYMMSSDGFIANNPKTIADFMTVFSTQYVSAIKKYNEVAIRHLKNGDEVDADKYIDMKMADSIKKAVEKAPGDIKLEVEASSSGVNKWVVVESDKPTEAHEINVEVRQPSKILTHLNILKGLITKLRDFNNLDYTLSENLEKALEDWDPEKSGMSKEAVRNALNIGSIDNSELVNYIAKCISAQYTFIVKHELTAYGKEASKAPENDEK